ncbi:MAG TPA: YqaJ viral recombinase family protein [Humibacter sp.]|nr:YqaJ viral recombinase family protein [Humibacter sp.]
MTALEFDDRPMLVIVPDGAPEEVWMEARESRVTASRMHTIADGSMKTWRRELNDQLNGSEFHGNAHTRRGHEREAELIRQAASLDGVAVLAPSHALYASWENELIGATPDGLGIHAGYGDFGAEAKSHAANWASDEIPADHYDQMQGGMYVTGFGIWLYVWEVEGQPGIQHRWVLRDDKRIEFLVRRANEYLAWRAAGAPDLWGGVDVEDDGHLSGYLAEQQAEVEHRKAKEAHGAALKARAAKLANGDERFRLPGTNAEMVFQRRPDTITFDEAAWAEGDPYTYKVWLAEKQFVAQHEQEAAERFPLVKPSAPTFRVTANGGA